MNQHDVSTEYNYPILKLKKLNNALTRLATTLLCKASPTANVTTGVNLKLYKLKCAGVTN